MNFDQAIARHTELGLNDDDLTMLTRASAGQLSLADVDRIATLSAQAKLAPSQLAFEAAQIHHAVFGDVPTNEPDAEPAPAPDSLQGMTQNQLWAMSVEQSQQRKAERAAAKAR